VGNQPTPVLITEASLIAWYAPAATRAGMARKNASRVAATRSRSRNRPALMVAPERDTPGIRATAPNAGMSCSLRSRRPCPVAITLAPRAARLGRVGLDQQSQRGRGYSRSLAPGHIQHVHARQVEQDVDACAVTSGPHAARRRLGHRRGPSVGFAWLQPILKDLDLTHRQRHEPVRRRPLTPRGI
jgi:hypothetical protein